MEIKIGYMVAYDYELLKISIPTVYQSATKIVLAMDKQRLTFKGEGFTVDASFFSWLQEFDKEKKIELYEDDFYMLGSDVASLDTRTRNLLSDFMGEGGWHFQIDADEYFIDFAGLVRDVIQMGEKFKNQALTIRVYWKTIFKRTSEGFFLVDSSAENFPVATNNPRYENRRYNYSNINKNLNYQVLHQSFGRNETDLAQKLRNWSHTDDFDYKAYFRFWQSVNEFNYKYIYDFNATHPGHWMRLTYVKAATLDELLQKTSAHLLVSDKPTHPRLQKWLPPVVYNRLLRLIES